MIPVVEASARILAAFTPLPAEWVTLPQALGRVLAEDVRATRNQPPKAVSAMDGYAVRSADLTEASTALRIIGEIPAGAHLDQALQPGACARIFTGAPLPDGADAIAIQENAERDGDRVVIHGRVAAGTFVRPAGLDIAEGEQVLGCGTLLSPRHLGLAASVGRIWLRVHRQPRVAILATGTELVLPGERPGPDQIVCSNSITLAGLVSRFGATPIDLGIAPDEPEALLEAARAVAGCDLVLTSGGASVGEHDLIRDTLGRDGLQLDFWRIAMRPGKPLLFGHLNGVPLLGLPGNPVSASVCALLFARGAIRRMLGLDPALPTRLATLAVDLPANDQRQDYLRAVTEPAPDGSLRVTPFARQDSSMFKRFAAADALVIRPPHAERIEAGAAVEIIDLRSEGLDI